MPPETAPNEHAETAPPNAVKPPPIEVPVAPPAHVAIVEQPSTTGVADIQALLPKDGSSATGTTVLLAAVAVAGSGAAMKLWQTISKNKHEERMKELERKENDHAKCEVARAALESKVTAIDGRLTSVEESSKSLELPDMPDFEEIESRLKKLEKGAAPKTKK